MDELRQKFENGKLGLWEGATLLFTQNRGFATAPDGESLGEFDHNPSGKNLLWGVATANPHRGELTEALERALGGDSLDDGFVRLTPKKRGR